MSEFSSRHDHSALTSQAMEELACAARYRAIGQQRARAARSYAASALRLVS